MKGVIGLRMDRLGKVFLRFVGGDERLVSHEEFRALAMSSPELVLGMVPKV